MKNLLYALLLVICFSPLSAQDIQWASEVVKFSSEYSDRYSDYYFQAHQVLGPPNAIQNPELTEFAWVPKTEDAGTEFIQVRFKKAMVIQQIAIAESLNPGSISRIYVYSDKGDEYKVYENKAIQPMFGQRLFRHEIPKTNYRVKELKLVLKTKAVPGSNQIDAIGISSSKTPIKINIDELTYAEEIPEPENLGPQVNSKFAERLPIISPDGQTLYFARKYHPDNMGAEDHDDIWVSKRLPDGSWTKAQNIGSPLNDDTHNFVATVHPNGSTLFLANAYKSNVKDGVSTSRKQGINWANPKTLAIKEHYNKNDFVSYSFNTDGNILLMCVERDEGLGQRDIFISKRYADGSWTKPESIGPTINTPNSEASVFLAADGKTIYFSSNGHNGYGGYDMFMSHRLDGSWTNWSVPKNLGGKINTPQNDYNYTIPASGEFAYFSSDYNSYGMSDLYRIQLPKEAQPEPVTLVKIRAVNAETNQPIEAKIKYQIFLEESSNDSEVAEKEHQIVLPNGEDYSISAEVDGFYAVSEPLALSGKVLEEIDYDGNEPEILKELQAPQNSNIPIDPELEKLRSQIFSLNQEIDVLENTIKSSESSPSTESKEEEPTLASTPKKVEDDPEIARLRAKFEQANKPRPVEETKTQKEEISEPEENKEVEPTEPLEAETPKKKTPSEDAELESLKNKFNRHLDNEDKSPEEIAKAQVKENKPAKTKNTDKPKTNTPREDNELTSLKDKFNKHLENETGEKQEDDLRPSIKNEEQELDTGDYKPAEAPKAEGGDYKPGTAPKAEGDNPYRPVNIEKNSGTAPYRPIETSFDEIKSEIQKELEIELRQEVKKELQDELLDEVRQELKEEMDADVRKQLEDDLQNEISNQLKKDLQNEVKDELKSDLKSEVEDELRSELKNEIEAELRKALEDEIKNDLREELNESVKKELKDQLEYRMKKEMEDQLRQEIALKEKALQEEAAKNPSPSENEKPEYRELEQDILLVPIKVGQIIPMNNIFFDANKSSLKEASTTELERVLAFLKKNNKLIIEIGGHTNGICSSSFADQLSSERASMVRDYLIDNGIEKNRIQFKGYGKTNPIASNANLAGRKKNQRVEMKILELGN